MTFPLDITKTRLQIQGEKASLVSGSKVQPYRGMLKTAYGIGTWYTFIYLFVCWPTNVAIYLHAVGLILNINAASLKSVTSARF